MKRFKDRKKRVIRAMLIVTFALFVWLLVELLFAETSGEAAACLIGANRI